MDMLPFNYETALMYIHGAHDSGNKNGLENMRLLLERLGNPQNHVPMIHVAGTNGKGSVCALLYAALHCAGYHTGLYTSPFLQRYNERMRVDGTPIGDEQLAALLDIVAPVVEALRSEGVCPTEFELGTALAFVYFAKMQVDIGVVEVGLGGRLDPTNVIHPLVCAIASIGLDHTHILGNTLEAIAAEKAGIAKRGVPLVLSGQADDSVQRVVKAVCDSVGAPFIIAGKNPEFPVGLPGAHQAYNASLAIKTLRQLRFQGVSVDDSAIMEGLCRAKWPGRLEWIEGVPPLLLDGAHNPQGTQALADYVGSLPKMRTVLLLGVMMDKDWLEMIRLLAPLADVVVTVSPDNKRSLASGVLEEALNQHGFPAVAAESLPAALDQARALASPSGRIVAAGSLYLVGALRTLVLGRDDALLSPI